VIVYAESSAVLAWLLGESSGEGVRELLAEASLVIASDLTLLECDRVLIRAVLLGEINEAEAADCRAHLNAASTHWQMLRVSEDIIGRARAPFPGEPIRTLDAIHLSSAIAARSAVAGVKLLSLDERVRRAARQLGFGLAPQ
jgi:predicted nucleic acid-binding protein